MAGEGLCGTAGRGPHRPSRGGNTGEPRRPPAAGRAGRPQAWFGLAWPGATLPGSPRARTLLAAAGDTDASSQGARPPSRLTQRSTKSLKGLPSPQRIVLKQRGQESKLAFQKGKALHRAAPLAPGREERGRAEGLSAP